MIIRPAIATALLNLVVVSMPSLGQDVVPRYKLAVGQEIQYQEEGHSESRSDPKNSQVADDQITRTIWVLGANADGSSRVLERDAFKVSEKTPGSEPTTSEREELSSFDVFPDGKVVPDEAKGIARHSLRVFPRLPQHAADKAWQSDYPDGKTEYAVLPGQTTAKGLVFRFEEHALDNEIYLAMHAGTVHFDPERGLLIAETSESSMDYGFHVKDSTSSRLKSVEMKERVCTEQLARESQAYFKVLNDYEQAETNANTNGLQGEAIMKRAGEELHDARSRMTLPMFIAPLDKMLSRHEQVAGIFKEESQQIAGTIDKPAADWTIKDLAGATHCLAGYRGRVVILDFWYRGCGWCMKAMPEMKKVADDFRGDPVAVLGMNSDLDLKDAQFVVDRMGINYTTLHSREIPEKYGVRAFPTVIIIDAEGMVRRVLTGYSPQMRDELDQEVRKLLPKPAAR